jgi:ApaG protein
MADDPDPYRQTTRGITVSVRPIFLEDRSRPAEDEYFWAYKVRIVNEGLEAVQLLKRTWRITDAAGKVLDVHGDGVVGEQPVLEPGESFDYTSGTPLRTPSGMMAGLYHMVAQGSGELFDVVIPAFSLDSPHEKRAVH